MRLPTLAVEPLILEIEVARDAQPDVIRDPPRPAELELGAGTQFDARVVRAFLAALDRPGSNAGEEELSARQQPSA